MKILGTANAVMYLDRDFCSAADLKRAEKMVATKVALELVKYIPVEVSNSGAITIAARAGIVA